MLLTLMRHGQAEGFTTNDAGRAVTDHGKEVVGEIVRGLRHGGWVPGAVVCSPLLRAQQTARILLEEFPGIPFEVMREVIEAEDGLLDEISYLDLVDPIIIGHEPGLSRLAARLIGAGGLLAFEEGAVACFQMDGLPPRRPAQLLFFAPPSFALALRDS